MKFMLSTNFTNIYSILNIFLTRNLNTEKNTEFVGFYRLCHIPYLTPIAIFHDIDPIIQDHGPLWNIHEMP